MLDIQLLTIVSMILGGIYLGVARETFQRLSIIWAKNTVLVYVAEIGFWFIQTIIIFTVLYKVNYGEVRIYTFLSILLGYSMYIVLFQSLYKRLLAIVIKVLKFVKRLTVQIVTIFIIHPVKWIIKLFIFFFQTIIRIILVILSGLFFPLKLILEKLNFRFPKRIAKFFNKIGSFYSTIKDKLKKS